MKNKILATIVLMVLSSGAFSADKNKAIFLKLFEVSGTKHQYMQMTGALSNKVRTKLISNLQTELTALPPAKRPQAKTVLKNAAMRINTELQKRLNEQLPYSQLIDQVYYPVYSKQFSVEEVKQIIKFYQSDVGKKYLKLSPQLLNDSAAQLNQKYNAQLQKMGIAVSELETLRVRQELNKLK